MAYETGTSTDHIDFFEDLRTFMTTTLGWTQLAYQTSPTRRMYFRAPGLSGTEEIYFGFGVFASDPTDTYGLYCWMAKSYDAGLDLEAQPGHSGTFFMPLWNTSIPRWFFGNGQRIIIVAKVSTTYQASYLGKFFQYGTTGEYGAAIYLGTPINTPTRFSSISENMRNFWDPGNGSRILLPNGAWWEARNFSEVSNQESPDSNGVWVHPYTCGTQPQARYREIRDNLDGSLSLFPTILIGDSPSPDVYGELDSVYAVPGFSAASEDTITVGSDTYIMFQNGFRTGRQYYAAIKQA